MTDTETPEEPTIPFLEGQPLPPSMGETHVSMPFIVYREATGEVLFGGTTMGLEGLAPEGCVAVNANYLPDHYWRDGALKPIPPRPAGDWAVFDYAEEQWIDPRSITELKSDLLDRATARRWEVETGGITLPGGITVKTGKADQDRITSVIANAEMAGIDSVNFKAESGWVTLPIAAVKDIARTIALHVQACFTAERAHHEAIAALNSEAAVRAYDVSVNWPG